MSRRYLLILAGLYLAACAYYYFTSTAITEPGYPIDDAWIHQVFARNLATGHGFSFNPDIPVSGATAPLWTLLLALFWPVMGPVASGLFWGLILEFLAIVAIYKLTLLITSESKLAFLTALLSILTWVLIWGALSGMEIGLYSALSLWGLYFYFKAESFTDKRNYLAYAIFTLAFLSRPECALFLAAATIRDFIIWIKSDQKKIVPLIWRIVPPVILLAPYFAFNYSVTGSPFTQTFAAKEMGRGLLSSISHGELKRIVKALSIFPYYYLQDFIRNLFFINPFILPAFIVGAIKFITVKDSLRSKRIMLLILLCLYVPLIGTFAPVLTATYHRLRLIENLPPLFLMVGIIGLFWKTEAINKAYYKYLLIAVAFLIAAGIFFLVGDDLIMHLFGPYLLQSMTRMDDVIDYGRLTLYVRETGLHSLLLALIFTVGIFLSLERVQRKLSTRLVSALLIILIAGYGLVAVLDKAGLYANDVKNINDMDKQAGIYLHDIVKKNEKVAVNDIGAIKYFSDATILDLKGLISPEITPPMILRDSLAFEYMLAHDHAAYVAIFPIWFDYIPLRDDIFKPVKSFGVEWNSILAGDTTVIYKAVWPDSLSGK